MEFTIGNVDILASVVLEEYPNLTLGLIKRELMDHVEDIDGELVTTSEDMEEFSNQLDRMETGIVLAGLCSAGKVECWWDNETNDMVFEGATNTG